MQKQTNAMQEGTREAYKEAYREFATAANYRPDDFELRKQRDDAYDRAVVKVILNPIQDLGVTSRYGSLSSWKIFKEILFAHFLTT